MPSHPDTNQTTKKESTVYVNLGPHLKYLQMVENAKPEGERRAVPTLAELAELAGVTRQTMSNLALGKTKSLKFKVASVILDEMDRRGLPMGLYDLIKRNRAN